jgi:hypothetical protein
VAEGEAARESYLACTGHHGFCIKTRCTSPITQDLTAEWSLFHKALAEILSTDRGKP